MPPGLTDLASSLAGEVAAGMCTARVSSAVPLGQMACQAIHDRTHAAGRSFESLHLCKAAVGTGQRFQLLLAIRASITFGARRACVGKMSGAHSVSRLASLSFTSARLPKGPSLATRSALRTAEVLILSNSQQVELLLWRPRARVRHVLGCYRCWLASRFRPEMRIGFDGNGSTMGSRAFCVAMPAGLLERGPVIFLAFVRLAEICRS